MRPRYFRQRQQNAQLFTAPILASVIGVSPKTWRISASADARPRHLVPLATGNYHWPGSILKQAQLSHPPGFLQNFVLFFEFSRYKIL